MITHSEERLEHVAASLLTQTENTDFDGGGAFIGTGRAGTHHGGMREKGVESGIAGKYELLLKSAKKTSCGPSHYQRFNGTVFKFYT